MMNQKTKKVLAYLAFLSTLFLCPLSALVAVSAQGFKTITFWFVVPFILISGTFVATNLILFLTDTERLK